MVTSKPSKIASSQILPLFPTFVWQAQFEAEVYEPINARVLRALAELPQPLPTLQVGSGWQSVQTLHELDGLRDLIDAITATTTSVLKFLQIGYETLVVTACWASASAPGAGHRIHSHPNNFLSGVYYVKTQKGADTINFHDPRMQTGIIRPPVTALTAENTDQTVVRVADGTLLVFPAWLAHSVDANASDDTRISVSFNAMFSSYTETMSKPLWSSPTT